MINYRVEKLEALVAELKKEGVTITDEIETVEYGKFVHIMDMEGNKIELWEPNDIEYDKIVGRVTKVNQLTEIIDLHCDYNSNYN